MKALKEPYQESYGMNYLPYFTDEFKSLIEKAKDKIESFVDGKVSYYTIYFKVKDEEVSREYDCCDDKKCIEEAKKAIRKDYGKYTRIEECWYDNDGDHESIERCCNCGKPLNEWLTWARDEIDYLESEKTNWDKDFFKDESFIIFSILESMPTMDYDISGYDKHQNSMGNPKPLKEALEMREAFFQKVGSLSQKIISEI